MDKSPYKVVGLLLIALGTTWPQAGCGPAAPKDSGGEGATKVIKAEAKSAQDYFPFAVGNSWTYDEVEQQSGSQIGTRNMRSTITLKVTNVVNKPEGISADVGVFDQDSKKIGAVVFLAAKDALYQTELLYKGKPMTLEPPMCVAVYPSEPSNGKTWTGVGPKPWVGTTGKYTLKVEGLGPVEVDGVNERFACLGFHTTAEYDEGSQHIQYEQKSYYAPRVGIVRTLEMVQVFSKGQQIGTVTKVSTLRSHTLK